MPKIFQILDKIKPVYNITEKVMMIICKLLLIADIAVTCYIVVVRYLTKKLVLVLDIISTLLVLYLGYVMLRYGWDSAYKMLVRNTKYDSLPWLSRFWMYFPVPVAGASMIIFEVEQLYQHIKTFFIKEEKEVAA